MGRGQQPGRAALEWILAGALVAKQPFLLRKLYLLFAPFGFAWLFAALALRRCRRPPAATGLGAAIPFLALCYVQTPERAFANAFFVIVPLAAGYLARAPFGSLFGGVVNGAVTAKVGSSTPWLPSSQYVIIPALILGAWCVWTIEAGHSRFRARIAGSLVIRHGSMSSAGCHKPASPPLYA